MSTAGGVTTADAPGVAARSWLARLIGCVVFVALAFGTVLPKAAGFGYLLLGLIGIVWLSIRGGWHRPRLVRHERLLVLSILIFAMVYLASWAWHGFDVAGAAGLRRLLRLSLIIPIYLLMRRVDGLEPVWWQGLLVGAWVSGLYAMIVLLSGEHGDALRVQGPTNPIYFGGITLIFGLMLLPRVASRKLRWRSRLLAIGAVVMALLASALSGSRGAWLALFPLAVLYILVLAARERPAVRFGVPGLAIVITLLVGLMPFAPLGERMTEGIREAISILHGTDSERSVGQRTQMWQLALDDVKGHPWFGVGPDGFRKALVQAVEDEQLEAHYLTYRHPHNQYLSALLLAGLPGLMALLWLLFGPAVRYAAQWHSVLPDSRLLAWCGLVTVFVLATLMLTESLFERNSGIVWFGLLIGSVSGLITACRQYLAQPAAARRQRLSVILIVKNEADRIGHCLQSISGWADEIIVLDSGSTDATVAICRRHTEQVEITDWPGFGRQKQRALDRASGDWVLSLDADEEVSNDLKHEIDLILSGHDCDFVAFRLPWETLAFGRRMQFGGWSRAPLRLFRRDAARFTDADVHEKLVLCQPGSVGCLEGKLIHRVFRDRAHAREKLGHYAALQARLRHRQGRRSSAVGAWLRAGWNFVVNFVVRGALLDGRAGLEMSLLHARYTYQKYQILHALHDSGGAETIRQ